MGAKILAAATSTDQGSLMAKKLQFLFQLPSPISSVLSVNSNDLHSITKTLHESPNHCLRPTILRIRVSFETGKVATFQWIFGKQNVADALKKLHPEFFILF